MSLNVGDVVQLKSGSPLMTVIFVIGAEDTPHIMNVRAKQSGYNHGDVWCEWFNGAEQKHSFFRLLALDKK